MFLIPFVAAFIGLLLFFLYLNYSLSLKRALYVRKMRFYRVEWDVVLNERLKVYSNLNLENKNSLLNKVSVFINEKSWPDDTEEAKKIVVSAMACLPIIKRKSNFYPSVTDGFLDYSQEKWFSLNEQQFENEVGKMALREFNDEFVSKSIMYFEDPKKFKNSNERLFQLLNHYYQFSN